MPLQGGRAPSGRTTSCSTLSGIAGLAAAITMLFLGVRAVMDIGGHCAGGGPDVYGRPCPRGVTILHAARIPHRPRRRSSWQPARGTRSADAPRRWSSLAWPALFSVLGFNFLRVRPHSAGRGTGLGLSGYLITGCCHRGYGLRVAGARRVVGGPPADPAGGRAGDGPGAPGGPGRCRPPRRPPSTTTDAPGDASQAAAGPATALGRRPGAPRCAPRSGTLTADEFARAKGGDLGAPARMSEPRVGCCSAAGRHRRR